MIVADSLRLSSISIEAIIYKKTYTFKSVILNYKNHYFKNYTTCIFLRILLLIFLSKIK